MGAGGDLPRRALEALAAEEYKRGRLSMPDLRRLLGFETGDLIDLLPRLFGKVYIPSVVCDELCHPSAPEVVRNWMYSQPGWLEALVISASNDPSLSMLDQGLSLNASLILMDDRRGAAVARDKGFGVTGTLGILDLAARRGMIDLADAFKRLRTTNFRRPEELLDQLLE